ncbi:MAG: hypothetical protein WAW21_15205, partial [Corynebacterium variabile]
MNRSSLPSVRTARPASRIVRGTAALAVAGSLILGVTACTDSDDDDSSDSTTTAESDDDLAFDSRLDAEENPT